MKTDKLFYRLFLSQPALIEELIPEIPIGCQFAYSAPTVKEKGFSLDGLLKPVSDDLSLPLVFLEAQMQPDQKFYSRYFAEIFLYLHQYEVQRPWYGLLILPNRGTNLGTKVPYRSLLDRQVKRLYLEDLLPLTDLSPSLALLKLLVVDQVAAASLAKSIIHNTETAEEFREMLDLVEAILVNKFPQLSTKEILSMLDIKNADVTQTRFYQEVFQVGEERGRQEGRQEGEQRGEQKGRKEEAVDFVLLLLGRRCGVLSAAQKKRIRSLDLDRLKALGVALLDFGGKDDLVAWLKMNG